MRIYVNKDTHYFYPVLYVLKIIEKNQAIQFVIVDSITEAEIFWDHTKEGTQPIYETFYLWLNPENRTNLDHKKVFIKDTFIYTENGETDWVATIFYMINCLQELTNESGVLDKFNRYQFKSSYQYRFNVVEENLVQSCIEKLLTRLKVNIAKQKTKLFISHDIDTIYGSFLYEGMWAIKTGRIDIIFKLILNEIIRKPDWKNIDKIIQINNEYDVKSVFFWIVNKGYGLNKIKNADYEIERERKLLNLVTNSGNINGLHKSSSKMSLDEELSKGNITNAYNRYHYLRYLPANDWDKISTSKIEFDSSLGFAEHYGFRNSYGMAFQPFNINTNRPFDFIEAPLNIMDGTFDKYMKLESSQIANRIIAFYEKHKYNCILSLLWHNTHFSNYIFKDFLTEYKKVLLYMYDNKVENVLPNQIIKENTLTW